MPGHIIMRIARRLLRPLRGDWHTRIQRDIWCEVQRAIALSQPEFPATLALPDKYGRGLPERVVEILLASLIYVRVVCARCGAMRTPCLALEPDPFTAAAEEYHRYRHRGTGVDVLNYYQKSVREDIARTKMNSDQFDCVWCISAIEHLNGQLRIHKGFEREDDLDIRASARCCAC